MNLVSSGEAHSSVPLLRPACEEFLWVKYLRTLKPELREVIVLQKSQIETADGCASDARASVNKSVSTKDQA